MLGGKGLRTNQNTCIIQLIMQILKVTNYIRQFCSSELSPQSLSWSHFQWDGMHLLLVHLNSFGSQVPATKVTKN